MIKRIKILATGALLLAGLGACSPSGKKTGADSTVDTPDILQIHAGTVREPP